MATDTVVEVVMPQMGVSVSEGTVTKWLRNVGDTIKADESLLEISTDKVDTEVPSPGSGVLREILVQEGETVPVGTVVGRIGAGDAAGASPPPPPPAPAPAPSEAPEPAMPQPLPASLAAEDDDEWDDEDDDEAAPAAAEPERHEAPTAGGNGHAGRHGFVSPVVARIASEHGVDPATIPGTGRDGRVTKKDILAFVDSPDRGAPATPDEQAPEAPAPPPPAAAPAPAEAVRLDAPAGSDAGSPASAPPASAPSAPAPATPTPSAPVAASASRPLDPGELDSGELDSAELDPGEILEPMTAMRRGIAAHMRHSLDTAAHVTSAIEVDLSKVVAIREAMKRELQSSYGVNPTYLAFVARATVDTLRDWPLVNAEIRGESIVTRSFVNLGFAVALDGGKGLIVPVLKHAEGLNLLGMARGIADLAERARTKKLLPDDVQGGTFTITNPGSFGTFMGTPIINQPQSAILGTYALVKRPWVITDDTGSDAIAIRPIMNLTLTYDHRLVDGAYGAQFLRDLAERLRSWGEADY